MFDGPTDFGGCSYRFTLFFERWTYRLTEFVGPTDFGGWSYRMNDLCFWTFLEIGLIDRARCLVRVVLASWI